MSTPPRQPRDDRPDLRPMIVLVAAIALVILGWLFLSPLVLPAAR